MYLGAGLLLAGLVAAGALTLRAPEVTISRVIRGETANEGDSVPVEVRIEARKRHGKNLLEVRDTLPGELELGDGNNYALLDLPPGEVTTLKYAARCPVKGFHAIGPTRVRVEDPFGLFHIDQDTGGATTVKVYPKVEDIKDAAAKSKYPFVTTGPFLVGNPGQGSSFFALREYNRGDSMRDVNWKASARSKSLVVNQRERESTSEITLLLDARTAGAVGTVRENSFLYACRAAASLTDFFLGNRTRVNLVVYGGGLEQVNKRVSQNLGLDVLEAVTRARPSGALSLEQVVEQILPNLKPKTPVYLLSSLVDDDTLLRAVGTLRSYDARVMVLSPSAEAFARAAAAPSSGAPAATNPGAPPKGDPPGAASGTALDIEILGEQRQRTIAGLRGMGALVLDWQPGASLSISLLSGVI